MMREPSCGRRGRRRHSRVIQLKMRRDAHTQTHTHGVSTHAVCVCVCGVVLIRSAVTLHMGWERARTYSHGTEWSKKRTLNNHTLHVMCVVSHMRGTHFSVLYLRLTVENTRASTSMHTKPPGDQRNGGAASTVRSGESNQTERKLFEHSQNEWECETKIELPMWVVQCCRLCWICGEGNIFVDIYSLWQIFWFICFI